MRTDRDMKVSTTGARLSNRRHLLARVRAEAAKCRIEMHSAIAFGFSYFPDAPLEEARDLAHARRVRNRVPLKIARLVGVFCTFWTGSELKLI